MKVQVTQTIIDAQKEAKRLNEHNAVLRKEKDDATSARDAAVADLNDVVSRKEEVEKEVGSFLIEAKEAVSKAATMSEESVEVIKEMTEIIKSFQNSIVLLKGQVDEEIYKIKAIRQRSKLEMDKILAEKDSLDVIKTDINIYKVRINAIITQNKLSLALL